MAIELSEGGGFTVTGAHIEIYRIKALEAALSLEINTGMKARGGFSPMNAAKDICGSPKRTKRGVLADYIQWCEVNVPAYRPLPSALRALGRTS